MATISQIKIGTTYYDLQDVSARTTIAAAWILTHTYHVIGSTVSLPASSWTNLVSTGSSSITYTDAWAIGSGVGKFELSSGEGTSSSAIDRRALRLHFTSSTESVDLSGMCSTSPEECGVGDMMSRVTDGVPNFLSSVGTSHVTNKAFVPKLKGYHNGTAARNATGKLDIMIFAKNGHKGYTTS